MLSLRNKEDPPCAGLLAWAGCGDWELLATDLFGYGIDKGKGLAA